MEEAGSLIPACLARACVLSVFADSPAEGMSVLEYFRGWLARESWLFHRNPACARLFQRIGAIASNP